MRVPPELQKHIDYALGQVERHPASDLDLDSRLAIYNFFSSLPDLNGRIARTHLSVMVAQKLLPLIEQPESGYSTMPHLMCATSAKLLEHIRGGITAEQLDELARTTTVEAFLGQEVVRAIFKPTDHPIHKHMVAELLWMAEEMDSLSGTSASSLYYPAYCVHLAAMNCLEEALDVNWWTGADGSQWAAIAYVGGRWTALEDPEARDDEFGPHGVWDYSAPDVHAKRREFWEWWGREAVPASWAILTV